MKKEYLKLLKKLELLGDLFVIEKTKIRNMMILP